MTESVIVAKILKLLRAHGAKAIKHHGSAFASAGEPDIIACIDGAAVVIECKMPGKKPTPLQMRRLEEWSNAGAIAFWCDDAMVFARALDRLGTHRPPTPMDFHYCCGKKKLEDLS